MLHQIFYELGHPFLNVSFLFNLLKHLPLVQVNLAPSNPMCLTSQSSRHALNFLLLPFMSLLPVLLSHG